MELVRRQIKNWGIIIGVFGIVIIFLSKLYVLFPLISKMFSVHGIETMFRTIGSFILLYGWQCILVVIYLSMIHGLGHLWAARRVGMSTSLAVFLPFIGGDVGVKSEGNKVMDRAFVAYMGSLFGVIAFLPTIPLYLMTKSSLWVCVAMVGSFLNLITLFPLSPLDGGKIVSVISLRYWGIGLILFTICSVMTSSGLVIIMILMGLVKLYHMYKQKQRLEQLEFQLPRLKIYDHSLRSRLQRYGYTPLTLLRLIKEYEDRIIKLESEGLKTKKERGELELTELCLQVATRLHRELNPAELELPVPIAFNEVATVQLEWEEELDEIKKYHAATQQGTWKYTTGYVLLVFASLALLSWAIAILPI